MVSVLHERSRVAGLIEGCSAEFIENKTTDLISPEDLRAPEVVLGLPWDEHVDIWSFGCLVSFSLIHTCDSISRSPCIGYQVYEFITDRRLFLGSKEGVDPDMLRIFQAYSMSGEAYPPRTIGWSKKAKKILDEKTGTEHPFARQYSELMMQSGEIKDPRLARVSPVDMQQLIEHFAGPERAREAAGCVDLIKSCLHVVPSHRASARELLHHPWVHQE